MSSSKINIDEASHKPVPTIGKRITDALICTLLGFLLVQLIGFWMFPGIGLAGIYTIQYSYFGLIGQIMNIYIVAFLGICAIFGWFRGAYFIDRLKGYLNFWKFW